MYNTFPKATAAELVDSTLSTTGWIYGNIAPESGAPEAIAWALAAVAQSNAAIAAAILETRGTD